MVLMIFPWTLIAKGEDHMNRLLEDLKISAQEEGPLGPYIGAYAAHLLSEGYARRSSRLKIRLVGGFRIPGVVRAVNRQPIVHWFETVTPGHRKGSPESAWRMNRSTTRADKGWRFISAKFAGCRGPGVL